MFERIEISNRMFDASPPSLVHGCAAQYVQTHFLRSRLHKTILDISITINKTSPIHNRRVVIAHCIDEPSTL
jgi:hypothetical protein